MPPLVIWGVAIGAEELLTLTGLLTATAIATSPQAQKATADAVSNLRVGSISQACSTCDPPPEDECVGLRNKIHELMYGRKGEGADQKGIFQRRAEQLAGQYGPGQTRLSSELSRDGAQRVLRQTVPWDTHDNEIKTLQQRIKQAASKYNQSGCGSNADANLNSSDVDRVLRDDFRPQPQDWKGPGQ